MRTIDALLDARPRAADLRLALSAIEEHRRRPLDGGAGAPAPLYEAHLPVPLSAVRRGGHDRRHELLDSARSSSSISPSELEEAARALAERLQPARGPYAGAPPRAWDDASSVRGSEASFTQSELREAAAAITGRLQRHTRPF